MQVTNYFVLDIETVGNYDDIIVEYIANKGMQKSGASSFDEQKAWYAKGRTAYLAKELPKLALNPLYGKIVCISVYDGFAKSDTYGQTISFYGDDEKDVIQNFVNFGTKLTRLTRGAGLGGMIVGHNVLEFDIDYIEQRARILRVTGLKNFIPAEIKPWDTVVFDTMFKWSRRYKNKVSLNDLAFALGLDEKIYDSGVAVQELYESKQWDELVAYCEHDVSITRSVYLSLVSD